MNRIRLIAVVQIVAQSVAQSVALAAILVRGEAFAATTQLSAEQAKVLADVRAASIHYTEKLPDFICTQTTSREVSRFNGLGPLTGEGRVVSTDVMEEKLTYFHHRESYEVVAINFKKVTGIEHTQVAGAISTGEFGSLLYNIFDPASGAVFSWDRMEKLKGSKAYVFAFQVPSTAGIHVADKISRQEISASYGGRIFVDAETKLVVRITTHIDLPASFAMKLAERAVDYRPVEISGKLYNLPTHSEVRMRDAANTYLNKIDFKGYHKFAVASTITYGNPGAGSTPAGETPATPAEVASAEPSAAGPAAATTPTTLSAGEAPPPLPSQPASDATAQVAAVKPVASPPTAPDVRPEHGPAVASPTQAAASAPAPETSYRLQVKVNEVLVPVVVRDAQQHAVGSLTMDDFALFDRNKRQEITSFSVEAHASPVRTETAASAMPPALTARRPANHFIVYLFDDLHLKFADLAQVREAAGRNLDTLLPTDRAAIFTTSGRLMLDFTSDRTDLHEALLKLAPHPLGGRAQECPDISFYMANQILNVYDPMNAAENPPLQAATAETMACMSLPQRAAKEAQDQAIAKARSVLSLGEQESRNALLAMKQIVHMIAPAPGTKTILLVSPGFGVESGLLADAAGLADEAIRSSVVISALDARGVYVAGQAGVDIESRSANANTTRVKSELDRDAAKRDAGVMQELAAATGGSFIQNTNDLASGFGRLTTMAEFTYLLGFTPQKLKPDGSFHALKVKLNTKEDLTTQARSGYYAPSKSAPESKLN